MNDVVAHGPDPAQDDGRSCGIAFEYASRPSGAGNVFVAGPLSLSPGGILPGGPMYALFQGKTQLGGSFATEKEVWEAALIDGLVADVPVADEEGGQILPRGYQ